MKACLLRVFETLAQGAGVSRQQIAVSAHRGKHRAVAEVVAGQFFIRREYARRLTRFQNTPECFFDRRFHFRMRLLPHMAHGSGQIRRADEHAIYAIDSGDGIDIF